MEWSVTSVKNVNGDWPPVSPADGETVFRQKPSTALAMMLRWISFEPP